ncbi:GNAT family N-acetyltransferase [Actinokineospora iranica]|uniref:Protein N-acetyltransferase, RimJ/RimL family n=1 Tax=Actinokineospora iranica TaxID=1271860 RepID=A0A1G6VYW6_9PSEU|nr:GNAT family protein [Actinokineospora iranica]SDD57975.1 Protein N-acetyltransferase, RimJ/RimL family [Actinokineospora iranica]
MTTNQSGDPILYLRGETAALGPLESRLAESYWRWENNPRVRVGYGQQTPESLEARTEGLTHQLKRSANQARFTVYDLTGDQPVPVGISSLTIDHPRRNAEFFILIGEDASTGRGIGTEATRLTLDYAFHVTNLRCVYLSVLAPNTAAIHAYEKAGFRRIGERRLSGYWLGEPANELFMDAIASDFPGPSVVKSMIS